MDLPQGRLCRLVPNVRQQTKYHLMMFDQWCLLQPTDQRCWLVPNDTTTDSFPNHLNQSIDHRILMRFRLCCFVLWEPWQPQWVLRHWSMSNWIRVYHWWRFDIQPNYHCFESWYPHHLHCCSTTNVHLLDLDQVQCRWLCRWMLVLWPNCSDQLHHRLGLVCRRWSKKILVKCNWPQNLLWLQVCL